MLGDLVASLSGNTEHIIVMDNASDPPVSSGDFDVESDVYVLRVPNQPPHLYMLWNIAFNFAEQVARDRGASEWNVSVFNDDTVLPAGWTRAIADALRGSTAVVACGAQGPWVTTPTLKTVEDGDVRTRMTPHAFMFKGESGIRADERFRWWWGDTDLDWQARHSGGLLIIPGYVAVNSCANSSTVGALAEQAGRDGQAFVEKWGKRLW